MMYLSLWWPHGDQETFRVLCVFDLADLASTATYTPSPLTTASDEKTPYSSLSALVGRTYCLQATLLVFNSRSYLTPSPVL
jgi:hypothetical protein